MPIAKYTSSKGLFELTDGQSGFFVEDVAVIENQQTLALTPLKIVITPCDDNDSGEAAGAGGVNKGELIGQSFCLKANQQSFLVWFDQAAAGSLENSGNLANTDGVDATGTSDSENYPSTIAGDYDYVIPVTLTDAGADNATAVATAIVTALNLDADFAAGFKAFDLTGSLSIVSLTAYKNGTSQTGDTSGQTLPSANSNDFTLEFTNGASHDALTNYGATSLSLATDPGAAGYETELALDDGDYIGQRKYFYCSATPSNSADIKITLNSANSITLDAADEFAALSWDGTQWVDIALSNTTVD